MIGKFLPNATKEQQAYKEQRQTTMLQQTGQFTMLTQFTKLEDPIAAALAAHGDGVQHKKKKSIDPNNFFNPNSTWR